jgi:hypothetical protein
MILCRTPPIQYAAGAFPQGVKRLGREAVTHLYLVPRSRKMELYLHSPYIFIAWCFIFSEFRG